MQTNFFSLHVWLGGNPSTSFHRCHPRGNALRCTGVVWRAVGMQGVSPPQLLAVFEAAWARHEARAVEEYNDDAVYKEGLVEVLQRDDGPASGAGIHCVRSCMQCVSAHRFQVDPAPSIDCCLDFSLAAGHGFDNQSGGTLA